MFNCKRCHKTSQPGAPIHKIVTQTRLKDYLDAHGQIIGHGHETVEEVVLCSECAKEHKLAS